MFGLSITYREKKNTLFYDVSKYFAFEIYDNFIIIGLDRKYMY